MALVILSAGSLSRSTTRTVSVKFVVALVLASAALVLATGFSLGYWLSRGDDAGVQVYVEQVSIEAENSPDAVDLTATVSLSDNRYLIDRFGEIAGRMIQLETEALELAERIGVINEFEERIKPEETLDVPKGRVARTPPGRPAGGPLLRPTSDGRGMQAGEVRLKVLDPLSDELSVIDADIERLTDVFADLDRIATSLNHAHMAFPGRQPVHDVAVTSGFGNRLDPFNRRRAFHSGVDFPAPRGTPIHSSAGGRVIFSGNRANYGLTVEIYHGAGLVSRYAHASKLLVKEGQVVMPGEKIALIGSTGRSTGPHLHFEILRDGHFVDPSIYLARF